MASEDEAKEIEDVFHYFYSLDRWPVFSMKKDAKSMDNVRLFHIFHDAQLDQSYLLYSINLRELYCFAVNYGSGLLISDEVKCPPISMLSYETITTINQNSHFVTVLTSHGHCYFWPRHFSKILQTKGLISISEHTSSIMLPTNGGDAIKTRLSRDGQFLFYQTQSKALNALIHVNRSSENERTYQPKVLRLEDVDDFDCTDSNLVTLDRATGVCHLLELANFADLKWKTIKLQMKLSTMSSESTNQLLWLPNISISEIACGNEHILFLSRDGDVFSCGNNQTGQIFVEDEVFIENPVQLNKKRKFSAIAAHGNLSVAKAQGQSFLWLWGPIQGSSRKLLKALPFESNLNRLSDVLAFYQADQSMHTGQRCFRSVARPVSFENLGQQDFTLLVDGEHLSLHRLVVQNSALFRFWVQSGLLDMSTAASFKLPPDATHPKEAYLNYLNFLYQRNIQTSLCDLIKVLRLCKQINDLDLSLHLGQVLVKHFLSRIEFGFAFRFVVTDLGWLELIEDLWRWFESHMADVIDKPEFGQVPIDFMQINECWNARMATFHDF